MTVTLVTNGSNYEVTNGLVGIRVPISPFASQLAPIQGIRLRDGTWTGTGPNTLRHRTWYEDATPIDPMLSAVTTVVTNTSSLVEIHVDYSFQTPDWDFSHVGVFIPGGVTTHKTVIRVVDGEPSILGEEDGNVDISYSLNCYNGISPNQARWRGWGANTIDKGRTASGELYGPWNTRAPQDAIVDLDYGSPQIVSSNSTPTHRIACPLFDIWQVDGGRYWQWYNTSAPSTGNLLGIYSGPGSRIIGGISAGIGFFHGPANQAGITIESSRMAADLNVSLRTRFAWRIFISTKADLLDPLEYQPIGLQFNKHSGLATKLVGYEQDFTNPAGGFGTIFMGSTAVNALKARVQSSFSEYQRIWNLDSLIRSVIDMWWNNDAASLQLVVDEVLAIANEWKFYLEFGDGPYQFSWAYAEGSVRVIRALPLIDHALANPLITPTQTLALKKAARLFSNIIWDDDFFPFSKAADGSQLAHVGLGTANMPTSHESYRDSMALYLSADPAWSARATDAGNRAVNSLHAVVNESGSPNASSEYFETNIAPPLITMLQLRSAGGADLFTPETSRLLALKDFFISFQTPYESRYGGWRKFIATGDGATEGTFLPGLLATCLRPIQPTAAQHAQHVWNELGQPHSGFFGSSVLMIEETATAVNAGIPDSAIFPGYLYTLRGLEAGWETVSWVIDGHFYADHRPSDQGVLTFYGYGQPISLSWGNIYTPFQVSGALWRSCIQPASFIDGYWDQPNLPPTQGTLLWTSTSNRGEFDNGSGQRWRRIAKLANIEGRHILAVGDTYPQQYVWSLNLMAQGNVTPPTGSPFTPPLWPAAPLNGSFAAGTYRWRFTGQWGVSFDLWIVAANSFETRWDQWSHDQAPSTEISQFQAATGQSFQETQYTLRIRTTGSLKWAITPYPNGSPWTGSVSDSPTGLLITGPSGGQTITSLDSYSEDDPMPNAIFNSFKRDIQNGSIDLDTDTINVMLVTAAYTPDVDNHSKRSDVTNEITGTGYTAGGQALASKTVTADNTDNEGVFDAADVTWATATFTARGAVLYKARGGAASADELIAYIDFGADQSSSGGNFVIQWATEGILNLN